MNLTEPINKQQLYRAGWTPALIAELLGAPDLVQHHSKGLARWVEHLYRRERVDAAARDPRFAAVQERREARKRHSLEKLADLPRRYPTWRAALPEACAGLFSLNRYAKHRNCGAVQRNEIYRLKNDLIELLYRHGYCTNAWIHRLTLAAKSCRECGGTGEDCSHCGYTGVYREASVIEFWCFQFCVEGRRYCWHQPSTQMDFAPAETVPPQEWSGLPGGEKPVLLARSEFAAVKALIRWVIERAAEPDAQPAEAGEPEIPAFALAAVAPPPSDQEQLPFTL